MELRWNLDDIYTSLSDKALLADKNRLFEMIHTKAEQYRTFFEGRTAVADKLTDYILTINEINSLYLKLAAFARLHLAIDTGDQAAMKLQKELEDIMPRLSDINLPFLRFLNSVGTLDYYIEGHSLLESHKEILRDLSVQASHLMDNEAEAVVSALQPSGSYAWEELHDELTKSLIVDVHIGGEVRSVPLSVARNMAYAQSQELRKAAYTAELKAYRKCAKGIAACLNSIKGEALITAHARGFEHPLDVTLADCRMERKTLNAMFAAIWNALPDFRRYMKHKAKLLGHEGSLPFYELYAPVGHFTSRFSYEDARTIIIREFSRFDEELGAFARNAFDNGWIDLEPREGKISGAFTCNLHAIKESRIMVNFTGTFYDLTTIAHELGHAYHNEVLKNRTILNNDYTMPLAETASIFCETLVTNAILAEADAEERFAILEHNLLNYTQICVEILARYTFETRLFEKRSDHPLSVEELNALMLDAQKYAYGDGLTGDLHPYMWACKPHYYFPDFHFYNFPYPYGLLFAKGLFAIYEKNPGPEFVTMFRQVLFATGSSNMEEIFQIIGCPSDSLEFYGNALRLITNQIDAFCRLD
ncbi:MAG: M3 family oligoendopeptidase [Lachnospiraceae bacterium]|nr:M3 family oligoendopeptidase [Lachnospiraceae bacterium]